MTRRKLSTGTCCRRTAPRSEQPQLRPKEVPAGTPPINEQHRNRSRASPNQQQKAAAPKELEPAERSLPGANHQPPSSTRRARGTKTQTKMTAGHTHTHTRWPQTSSATQVPTTSHTHTHTHARTHTHTHTHTHSRWPQTSSATQVSTSHTHSRWPQTSSTTQVSPYPHLRRKCDGLGEAGQARQHRGRRAKTSSQTEKRPVGTFLMTLVRPAATATPSAHDPGAAVARRAEPKPSSLK